jgi:hypothetical protein
MSVQFSASELTVRESVVFLVMKKLSFQLAKCLKARFPFAPHLACRTDTASTLLGRNKKGREERAVDA